MARSSQASAVFTHTQLGFYAVAAFGLLYVYSDSAQVRWWAQAEVESRAASIAPHAARPPHRRIPATTTPPHACRRSLSACTSPRNGGTCMVRGKCSRRAGAACWQRRARAGSERAHTFRGSAAPAPSSPPCPPLLPHLQAPCACRPTCTCAHSFARSWGRPTGRSQCSARQGGGEHAWPRQRRQQCPPAAHRGALLRAHAPLAEARRRGSKPLAPLPTALQGLREFLHPVHRLAVLGSVLPPALLHGPGHRHPR
jgi:hypothetical protein